MKYKILPPLHREVYRGIGFEITCTGVAIFDTMMPPCRDCIKRNWCDVGTRTDQMIAENGTSLEDRIVAMRRIIDNAKCYM